MSNQESISEKQWFVWCQERGPAMKGHPTMQEAQLEALRLAGKERKTFLVLELVGKAFLSAPPVDWEPIA